MAEIKSPNGILRYTNSVGSNIFRYVWIYSLEQAHGLAGSTAQAKRYRHFYSKSNNQGPLQVTGRVPTQEHFLALAQHVRAHQLLLMDQAGTSNVVNGQSISLMWLAVPSENFYVEGFVTSFAMSHKRFNVAPQFQLDFQVIKDYASNNSVAVGETIKSYFWNYKELEQLQLNIDLESFGSNTTDPVVHTLNEQNPLALNDQIHNAFADPAYSFLDHLGDGSN